MSIFSRKAGERLGESFCCTFKGQLARSIGRSSEREIPVNRGFSDFCSLPWRFLSRETTIIAIIRSLNAARS